MNPDLVEDADEWLAQTIHELQEDDWYKHSKEGWDLIHRVVFEIHTYAPELQEAVSVVLGQWLLSEDIDKVTWGLWLISELAATEHIATLKRLRARVLLGQSPMPEHSVGNCDMGDVDRLLERLRMKYPIGGGSGIRLHIASSLRGGWCSKSGRCCRGGDRDQTALRRGCRKEW